MTVEIWPPSIAPPIVMSGVTSVPDCCNRMVDATGTGGESPVAPPA